MDRHILGTFSNEKDTIKEVNRLISEEGYSPDELALVMDEHNEYDDRLDNLKNVQVDQVTVEEADDNVWEKIKETFSFGSYDSEASHSVLEDYGVPHDRAEHYMDALHEGEIILLANSDAPRTTELSEVNEEIVKKERIDMADKEKREAPLDEVNSEEESAIKNDEGQDKDPKDVETSETDDESMTDSIDPSQAEHTRKEEVETASSSSDDEHSGEDLKQNKEEDPDLTGEEETVEVEESEHGYGNDVAKGVVKPEPKSPLNTEDKHEKDPSEKSDAPESDANYPEDSEDAGMKSEN